VKFLNGLCVEMFKPYKTKVFSYIPVLHVQIIIATHISTSYITIIKYHLPGDEKACFQEYLFLEKAIEKEKKKLILRRVRN
jgi:hypothetical protein